MNFRQARVTLVLSTIMVCVLVFEEVTGAFSRNDPGSIISVGAVVPHMFARLELWRLLTFTFLHGGVLHLVFNLWAFVQLGFGWELLFGRARFLFAFLGSSVIAGGVSAMYVHPGGALGASGAIFGLLSALIVLLFSTPQWNTAPWVRRLALQMSIWAILSIILGFFSPMIDNAAHVGGLIGGIGIGLFLGQRRFVTRPQRPDRPSVQSR
jgi:rhomboid protease GluP